MKFRNPFKKPEQPSFVMEPIGPEGYYKYKSRFINIEQKVIFSSFLKSAFSWFYIYLSIILLLVVHAYLYNKVLPTITPQTPLFFKTNLVDSYIAVNILFSILTFSIFITFFLALLIYNKYSSISKFLIIMNITGDVLFIIGIFKMLNTFTS